MDTIIWLRSLSFVAILILMIVGLLGMIIPFYPGLLMIWIGCLLYGLVNGFEGLGGILFIIITLLALFGSVVDNIVTGIGAHHGGVPWITIIVAALCGFFLTFFHPLVGLLSVPFVLFLLEWRRLKDISLVRTSLLGLLKGWISGLIARFGVGLVMVILWGIWVWLK